MKNLIIVKFHIGRGGRFNNQGHLTFKGVQRIDEGDSFNELFFNDKTKEYQNCQGGEVGLTEVEADSGIGRIDQDGDYDTTYTTTIEDLTEEEESLIRESSGYEAEQIIEYLEN